MTSPLGSRRRSPRRRAAARRRRRRARACSAWVVRSGSRTAPSTTRWSRSTHRSKWTTTAATSGTPRRRLPPPPPAAAATDTATAAFDCVACACAPGPRAPRQKPPRPPLSPRPCPLRAGGASGLPGAARALGHLHPRQPAGMAAPPRETPPAAAPGAWRRRRRGRASDRGATDVPLYLPRNRQQPAFEDMFISAHTARPVVAEAGQAAPPRSRSGLRLALASWPRPRGSALCRAPGRARGGAALASCLSPPLDAAAPLPACITADGASPCPQPLPPSPLPAVPRLRRRRRLPPPPRF